jgi:hypothetical protein
LLESRAEGFGLDDGLIHFPVAGDYPFAHRYPPRLSG